MFEFIMCEKSSVSILQELCAQRKSPLPTYNFEKVSDVFVCVVEAFKIAAKGAGRSKIHAKQASCSELIRK